MSASQPLFKDATLNRIALFLQEIGIEVAPAVLTEETFLPGTKIAGGKIWVDESKILSPGDVLHEAGHLAVIPSEHREALAETGLINEGGNEMAAIAWSWAANTGFSASGASFWSTRYDSVTSVMIQNVASR